VGAKHVPFPLSSGPPGDGMLGVCGVPGTLVGGPGGTFGLSEFGAALTAPSNTIPIIRIRTKAFFNFSPRRNFRHAYAALVLIVFDYSIIIIILKWYSYH
jgi:hypothetical protein